MGKDPEISTCATCGHKWRTGTNGDHSCTDKLLDKVARLEKEWRLENRIIELLIAGDFVSREKVEQARDFLSGMQ